MNDLAAAMRTMIQYIGLCVWAGAGLPLFAAAAELPDRMTCVAQQTAGFHDYPHNAESYEPVIFYESQFRLSINRALTQHLSATDASDLYLTLRSDDVLAELSCVHVRSVGQEGFSCHNSPPSELLLINQDTLRFTRTSIGGWTFAGGQAPESLSGASEEEPPAADTAGDSIFVEYGVCKP